MKIKFTLITLFLSLLFSTFSHAKNMTELGSWLVHHIAFPSTFIQAKTAKALNLKHAVRMLL